MRGGVGNRRSLGASLIEYFQFQQRIVEAALIVGQHLHNARFNTVLARMAMHIGHDVGRRAGRKRRGEGLKNQ